jgi:hypothetical protein
MTTVADLIKVLQTLPPETKVKALTEYTHGYDVVTKFEDIGLEHGIDGCDHLWFGTLDGQPVLRIGSN